MRIEKITLCFENCEEIEIDGKYIFELNMENLIKRYSATHYDQVYDFTHVEKFSMGILKEADSDPSTFSNFQIPYNEGTTYLGRIMKWRDLVSVVIKFDDREERFYVEWGGDDDFVNNAQRCEKNEHGDIYLAVGTKYKDDENDFANIQFKILQIEKAMKQYRRKIK